MELDLTDRCKLLPDVFVDNGTRLTDLVGGGGATLRLSKRASKLRVFSVLVAPWSSATFPGKSVDAPPATPIPSAAQTAA